MKRFALLLALLCTFVPLSASAGEELEVKRVELDSLVRFLRKNTGRPVYYVKDEKEQSTFTLRCSREALLDSVRPLLAEKGYRMSEYGEALFILHSQSIRSSLPYGYFDRTSGADNDSTLRKYLADRNMVATFANKVYEIGEKEAGRTGKVYVSGHVRDVASGEPLVGVSVYDGSGLYTVTDAAGFYKILLPVGSNTLNFSGYSMDDLHLSLLVYDNGGLDVTMKEKVTALKGAVVSADQISHHKDAIMGVEKVRVNMVKKIPTAFGESDVLKVVLTLPGVKSAGEASNGFNVRGGSSDQNLILFNDNTIYNPSHMFGVFSAFNTDVISGIELYKSSIPVEYGGRISSVLDVRGREGNSKKITGSLGIGLLTGRFHLEGPIIKDRTTFIIGGRTSYSNWILNLLPKNASAYAGGRASFRDLNVNVSHRVNGKNSIHACAYTSYDGFSFSGDTTFRYSNLNLSLKWRSNFSERNSMVATAGYDGYNSSLENSFNRYSGYNYSTGIRQAFAKLNFKTILNDSHTFSYGFDAVYYMLNPGAMAPLSSEEVSFVKNTALPMQKALEPALYFGDSWRVSEKLSFDLGLRMAGFLGMENSCFYGVPELRVSGKYSFRPDLSIKAGFNSMSQNVHLISNTASVSPMDTWQLSNASIKPQTGWQAASGLYWTVAEGKVDISLEGYWKKASNMLDYKSGAVLVMNENLVSDLVPVYNRAYGVEFMVRKSIGKLNGWLSYTYSRSLLKEMQDRGPETINGGGWYNAPHDKPHDFKLVGNYKFTHRFSLSCNADYSTGRPVTVPIGVFRYGGGKRLEYSDRNEYRIPDYFRLDLAVNVEPSHYLKKLTYLSFTLGVYNVTGRKNAYSVYYTTEGAAVSGHMLSVFACPIPYLNLNLKF